MGKPLEGGRHRRGRACYGERMSTTAGKELWLVRHGQTTRNRDRELAGWDDVFLTPEGELQAAALRPQLDGQVFTQVWASDLSRAVRTAELGWGVVPTDARLREINFGDLEGKSWETLDPEHKDALLKFEGFAAPNGESLLQLEARILSFVDELPLGRHLLFTHGGVIRLLCHRLGQSEFVQPATITIVDWHARKLLRRSA